MKKIRGTAGDGMVGPDLKVAFRAEVEPFSARKCTQKSADDQVLPALPENLHFVHRNVRELKTLAYDQVINGTIDTVQHPVKHILCE
jgi:hypothetical protein